MTFPPIPSVVQGLSGPIRVRRPLVVDPTDPDCFGMWLALEREVLVRATLKRRGSWSTLLHELGHAAIDDAGIKLSEKQEEAVVESIASGMIHVLDALVARKP